MQTAAESASMTVAAAHAQPGYGNVMLEEVMKADRDPSDVSEDRKIVDADQQNDEEEEEKEVEIITEELNSSELN